MDSQGAGSIDLNTTGWPRGRLLRFHVYSIATYNTPLSGWSGNAQKNRAPNAPAGTPATDKAIYSPGDTITLTFTPNGTPDPDGNLSGYEAAMQSDIGQWYGAGPTNRGPIHHHYQYIRLDSGDAMEAVCQGVCFFKSDSGEYFFQRTLCMIK